MEKEEEEECDGGITIVIYAIRIIATNLLMLKN